MYGIILDPYLLSLRDLTVWAKSLKSKKNQFWKITQSFLCTYTKIQPAVALLLWWTFSMHHTKRFFFINIFFNHSLSLSSLFWVVFRQHHTPIVKSVIHQPAYFCAKAQIKRFLGHVFDLFSSGQHICCLYISDVSDTWKPNPNWVFLEPERKQSLQPDPKPDYLIYPTHHYACIWPPIASKLIHLVFFPKSMIKVAIFKTAMAIPIFSPFTITFTNINWTRDGISESKISSAKKNL